jgi:hypothetical protein
MLLQNQHAYILSGEISTVILIRLRLIQCEAMSAATVTVITAASR